MYVRIVPREPNFKVGVYLDKRTKRQKLQDMANQTVSPNEAEIARAKLDELPEEPTSDIYYNGIHIGKYYGEVKFNVVLEPDPGVGVFDFVNMRWSWTPKGTGTN